jgi:thiol:disulfide interchange protein/DsbC/DsbD-like thiol-disulfide interchange protein
MGFPVAILLGWRLLRPFCRITIPAPVPDLDEQVYVSGPASPPGGRGPNRRNAPRCVRTLPHWNSRPDFGTLQINKVQHRPPSQEPRELVPNFKSSQPAKELRSAVRLLPRPARILDLARILALAFIPGLAGAGQPAFLKAQVGDDMSPHSEAHLVPEVTSIQPGTPFTVALFFEMDPGWHIYWRNPGDSGLPTTIAWTLPPGFEAGDVQWPTPSRIAYFPLVDYGYYGEVALLVEITPPHDLAPVGTVPVEAFVEWLICQEICLPAYAELRVEIPVSGEGPRPDPRWAGLFHDTRASLPAAVGGWNAEAEVTISGYVLGVWPADGQQPLPDSVYFFPSDEAVLDHAAPQRARIDDGRLTLTLDRSAYARDPSPVLRGVLLREDGGTWDEAGLVPALAVEAPVEGVPAGTGAAAPEADRAPGAAVGTATLSGVPAAGGPDAGVTVALALLFAFLGGILLNLMPCVFPVLSIKLLGAVGQGGGDRAGIRNQGLFFGLGVLLSFLALAGLLIALRAGGAQLGWGFQLQSPVFVALMAGLFFAIGLNLMGLFEVGMTLTRLGGRAGAPSGFWESLSSGVLATVIATPCTAPFMGAALGFALTRSVAETLLIFGFLGIGMALPYMVLSVAPGLLERLPRPGPWMETLKQVLAFPMFATVIWLVWVFGQQTGTGGMAYLLTALLLVSAAGWMVGHWHRTDLRSGVVARVVSLAALALAAAFVARGSAAEPPPMAVHAGWQPFTQEAVESTLAQGRPVFVDFTAAWCLTCQVNERLVLSTDRIMEAFRARNVALFMADWTRQDPHITTALAALGRSGVPVYALYAGNPGSPPRLLPAVLTEQIVLSALEETVPLSP